MKKIQKYSSFLVCLLVCLMVCPISVMAEEDNSKVVRVGWYEDSYHITGENGERSGYCYEYEQAVAAYTGWTYEYVKGDWSELLEMLQNGEIDLMGALSYTEERAETMLFSELPMGEEKYYLYADLTDEDISASDLSTLNGKKIVVMEKSVQSTQFTEWEKQHKIETQHINLDSFEEARDLALKHEIDGVISTETPAWSETGMSAIATTGGSDIYYGVNKERPDLKEELDTAMRKMEADKPFYADELYQRYLSAQSMAVLSSEEKEWLEQHGAIHVGFLNHDSGITTFDAETGELSGIITDYIVYATDCLGENTLKFDLMGFDSLEEEIAALKNEEIDMIFHVSQNPYEAEQNGLALSNTVMSPSLAVVTKQRSFDEEAQNRVAVQKDDLNLKWYISYYYSQWEMMEYDSSEEVENAVAAGDADCFICDSGEAADYIKDSKLHSIFLMQADHISFGVSRGNAVLLSILNKTLTNIPESKLTGALSVYNNALRKVTLLDFIKNNLLLFALGFSVLFLSIVLVILSFLRKAKAAEAKARQAAIQSQKLNEKLKESQLELKDALLQAESANSAKTAFLNNMSHDIRTPMNAIIGFTTLASSHTDNQELVKDYLKKIGTSSEHLLSLINDVLDMSRIESGKVKIDEKPLHLSDLLNDIRTMIRPSLSSKQLDFLIDTVDVVDEDIIADKLRLTQILLNILSNAEKYNKTGGSINLTVKQEKCAPKGCATYHFVIKDTGIGISEEFQKHIFENFSREETATVSGIQGTGLGLAITKKIVEMMGGAIHLQSEEGVGSEFDVCLTFKLDGEKKGYERKDSLLGLRGLVANDDTDTCRSFSGEGKKILLVEDNKLNQEIAVEILTGAGFKVEVVSDGSIAVEKMANSAAGQYNLILMDIQMPIMNGYEATRQIRAMKAEHCRTIPIIAMTANAFEDDRTLAAQAGMNGYLTKPIQIQNMLRTISQIL